MKNAGDIRPGILALFPVKREQESCGGLLKIFVAAPFSKEQAHYGPHSKYPVRIRSCGICEHFVSGGLCYLVRGTIAANGGCALYQPAVLPKEDNPWKC
jgi:hypothetical protein